MPAVLTTCYFVAPTTLAVNITPPHPVAPTITTMVSIVETVAHTKSMLPAGFTTSTVALIIYLETLIQAPRMLEG